MNETSPEPEPLTAFEFRLDLDRHRHDIVMVLDIFFEEIRLAQDEFGVSPARYTVEGSQLVARASALRSEYDRRRAAWLARLLAKPVAEVT